MASKVSVARALAAKFGVKYNRGRGPDIRTDDLTINVETSRTLETACGRLRGYRGPVYIALANPNDLEDAEWYTFGTTVGLMDAGGKIIQESTRGYWP